MSSRTEIRYENEIVCLLSSAEWERGTWLSGLRKSCVFHCWFVFNIGINDKQSENQICHRGGRAAELNCVSHDDSKEAPDVATLMFARDLRYSMPIKRHRLLCGKTEDRIEVDH